MPSSSMTMAKAMAKVTMMRVRYWHLGIVALSSGSQGRQLGTRGGNFEPTVSSIRQHKYATNVRKNTKQHKYVTNVKKNVLQE